MAPPSPCITITFFLEVFKPSATPTPKAGERPCNPCIVCDANNGSTNPEQPISLTITTSLVP